MGKVLVVAAEARELAGVLRHCDGSRRLPWPLRFAREAELSGMGLVMVADGAGPKLAGRAADVAGAHLRFDAVISAGACGALDPALRAGEVFVATRVDAPGDGASYEARLPECGCPHAAGRLVSVDRVIRNAEEKRRLRMDGAQAVEMEASAVAARARKWGIPFFCVRAVSDQADEELLLDYNATRDQDGRLSTWRILAAAVRRPVVFVPELWKMYHRSRRAASVLGEFFANCRFQP